MKISSLQYDRLVKEYSPNSHIRVDTLNAFWIGGLICVLGQLVLNGWAVANCVFPAILILLFFFIFANTLLRDCMFCTYVGLQISQTSISNIRFYIGSCE